MVGNLEEFRKSDKLLFWLALSFCFLSSIPAILSNRIVYNSPETYLDIFSKGFFLQVDRFSTLLFQLPYHIADWLTLGNLSVKSSMWILNSSYQFHPILSLILCYMVLKKVNKQEWIVFPLISFAMYTQNIMSFGIGVLQESTSFFWPLFLLIIFNKRLSVFQFLFSLPFVVLLNVSYEPSVIFNFILIYVHFWAIRETKCKYHMLLVFIEVIGIVYFFQKMTWAYRESYNYLDSMQYIPLVLSVFMLVPICLLWKSEKLSSWVKIVLFSIGVVLYPIWMFHLDPRELLPKQFHLRVILIPLVAVLAGILVLKVRRKRAVLSRELFVYAIGVTVISAGIELYTGLFHYKAMKDLSTIIENAEQRCIEIKDNDEGYNFYKWTFEAHAILLQNGRVEKLIYSELKDTFYNQNCIEGIQGVTVLSRSFPISSKKSKLNFLNFLLNR